MDRYAEGLKAKVIDSVEDVENEGESIARR